MMIKILVFTERLKKIVMILKFLEKSLSLFVTKKLIDKNIIL